MLVGSVMNSEPVVCQVDDSLAQATEKMAEGNVGFVPVIDGKGALVGVLTDRDALLAAHRFGTTLRDITVGDAMTYEVQACTIHDEIRAIQHRMAHHRIRRLPVTDDAGRPVGVVTLTDIAQASLRDHEVSSRTPTWVLAALKRDPPPS